MALNNEDSIESTMSLYNRKLQNSQDLNEEPLKSQSGRFETLNIISKDVGLCDNELTSLYCFICGLNCLIVKTGIDALPRYRRFAVLDTETEVYKSYLAEGPLVYIKNEDQVEICRMSVVLIQGPETFCLRLVCPDCTVHLGYRNCLRSEDGNVEIAQ